MRTIPVFDDHIIEIEFNVPYSNEIGDRFWKHFDKWEEEIPILQKYTKASTSWENDIDDIKELTFRSNIKLAKDMLNDCVYLPDEKYAFKGKKEAIITWLHTING